MSLKARKRFFYILILVFWVAVFIYEYLTPYLSDDIVYMDDVSKANSFFDLFSQEAYHYMNHTGRSVAHMILRIFLYIGPKLFFDVVASTVFVVLSILIYLNVYSRKEYDVRLYGFILAMLWFLEPSISDSVFWEDGACNYLFTTTIIMGFITVYRLLLSEKIKAGKLLTAGLFFFGIIAGWCNENTSGGLVLFILTELIVCYCLNGRKKSFFKPYMITGLMGSIIGLGILVASPGNFGRLEVTEEEHTGVMAFVARFLKITKNIQNYYIYLVVAVAVIIIILAYYCKEKSDLLKKIRVMLLFSFLFFATSYALIMVPYSELRSYFGADIFLMTAVANGISELAFVREKLLQAGLTGTLAVAGLIFVFAYFDDGANLARINREFKERDAYFAMLQENGQTEIAAPLLRPDWKTRFSSAYRMDIQEDWQYWINTFYATHYNLDTVTGVPREDWTIY